MYFGNKVILEVLDLGEKFRGHQSNYKTYLISVPNATVIDTILVETYHSTQVNLMAVLEEKSVEHQ